MKTITEFHASAIKNALKTQQELQAAGKTADEMPAALGEALKLEGDKLAMLVNALETVNAKVNDLKRVVVLSLSEGEKAPSGFQQKGDHYFGVEYYPPIARKGAPGPQAGARGGKPGDRKGKGRRGGRGRDDRRGPGAPGGAPKEAGERGPRGPRPPRGPKPAGNGGAAKI